MRVPMQQQEAGFLSAEFGRVVADEWRAEMATACDPVSAPAHYMAFGEFEPIRVGVMRYGRGVLCMKIDKYISRSPMKNGAQDLAKAGRCLEMLTKFDAGDPDWWKPPHTSQGDHA